MELRFGDNNRKFLEMGLTPEVLTNGELRRSFIQINYYNPGELYEVIREGLKKISSEGKVWMTMSLHSIAELEKRFPYKNGEPNENYEPPQDY